ncbi:hypothetical protein D0T12_10325 [Actinomadura spongiicola]|uniref:Peptidase M23 domain-containing protein n=2 Tax=Actinomadura spongiicola TaxID=2303421 RepID=A0A372GJ88_9ACTN|nr:hypothetical protein D0T12_10325 [Actinomadura spongiicola]
MGHASRNDTHAERWAETPPRPSSRPEPRQGPRSEEPQWPEGSWWSEQPDWFERGRRSSRRGPSRRETKRREKAEAERSRGRAGRPRPRPRRDDGSRRNDAWDERRYDARTDRFGARNRPPETPTRPPDPLGGPPRDSGDRFDARTERLGAMPERNDARMGGPAPRRDRSRETPPRRAGSRRGERTAGPERSRPRRRAERQARHGVPPRPGPKARPRRGRGPSDRLGIGAIVLSTAVGLSLLGIAERALLEGGPIGGPSGPIGSERALTPPKSGGGSDDPARRDPRPGQSGAPDPRSGPDLRLLTTRVRKLTLEQRGVAARRAYGAAPNAAPIVGTTRTSADKTWVFGTTAIPVPAASAANPEVAFYAARWTGREWQVALSGGRLFDDLLGAVPTNVMPVAEARALRRYATVTAAQAAAVVTGARGGAELMLPWKIGEAWSMTTSDGSATPRPLASLAFSGGDGRVLASGDGHLYRFCADPAGHAMLMVIHPSGVATTYHHVGDVPAEPRDGAVVERGDPLGRTGTVRPCGGAAAPRAEVAFGVRRGGGTVPLAGARIGGWTFREDAEPSRGFAERGVLQVLPGGLLANLGPVPPADESPTTPTSPSSPPSPPPSDVPPEDGAGPAAAPAAAATQKRSPIGENSPQ